MLQPTGFWSYTRSDDLAARGSLSQLRALLAQDLQLKIGRSHTVNIWQDVSAIPPGTRWLRQIRDFISDSSFLIPIVTPALLQSKECCREIILFRERLKLLKRDDLIFPIHYVDVSDIDGSRPVECHDPKILEFLKERQWLDFLELRLGDPKREEVLRALSKLADEIRKALRSESSGHSPGSDDHLDAKARELSEELTQQLSDDPSIGLAPDAFGAGAPSEAAGKATPSERTIFEDFEGGPRMVELEPGTFKMGSPESELGHTDDESPLHQCSIEYRFAVAISPVTFSQWAAAQAEGAVDHVPNDHGWGGGDQPVIDVSWDDSQRYLEWLCRKSGHKYRLLTETEWEYAARAGTKTAFWWGTQADSTCANYDGRYTYGKGPGGMFRGKPVAVERFEPNPWGLYQVHGNIWEWCQDNWVRNYADASGDGSAREVPFSPSFLPNAPSRVVRGGSWRSLPKDLRSARRFHFRQDYRGDSIGFRVARNL
jgi:formylglycine-generating enzyme required for sulfatase activity